MNRRKTLLGLLAVPFSAFTSAFAGTPLEAVMRKAHYECQADAQVSSGPPLRVAVRRVADVEAATLSRRDEDLTVVDFYATEDAKQRRQQKSAGPQTYVVSAVSGQDIVSTEHLNCTGSVFVGTADNGAELAFVTHQDPTEVLHENRARFEDDFSTTLEGFLGRVTKDSVTFGFFGGNYFHAMTGGPGSRSAQATLFSEHYVSSIVLLAEITRRQIPWLEPRVAIGPNLKPAPVHFRFHTQQRRLEVVTEHALPAGYSVCGLPAYLRQLEKRVL